VKPEPVSASASEAWRLLRAAPIAHRGLWSAKGAPENSLTAFEAAAEAGYGVELDVRLSADGEVMVFHDDRLERMVGRQGRLCDYTAAELGAMRLKDTRDPVPTLGQVFDLIDGAALIHIELKTRPGEEGPLDEAVAALVDGYAGPLAVIGFNPQSHLWWARRRPGTLRGLTIRDAESLVENIKIGRPHFLAVSTDLLMGEPTRRARDAGLPILAWTIRSEIQRAELAPLYDNLIFEGFMA